MINSDTITDTQSIFDEILLSVPPEKFTQDTIHQVNKLRSRLRELVGKANKDVCSVAQEEIDSTRKDILDLIPSLLLDKKTSDVANPRLFCEFIRVYRYTEECMDHFECSPFEGLE